MAQRINHCIGLRFLSNQSILSILDEAEKIKSGDSIVNLQNQSVAHVFLSPQHVLDYHLKWQPNGVRHFQ